jgi:hypothetical protein
VEDEEEDDEKEEDEKEENEDEEENEAQEENRDQDHHKEPGKMAKREMINTSADDINIILNNQAIVLPEQGQ